jgi:ABC-2 type transport system permease protein
VSFARDVLLIFKRQLRLSLRNPAWVVIGLTQPILYLAFFGPLFAKVFSSGGLTGVQQTNSYAFFVPGLLVQLGLFGAAFVGFTIIADWRAGVVERMRVTPVSRLAILLGRVLRDVVVLTVQAVVLIVAGFVAGMRAPLPGVLIGLGFISLLAVSLASVSYTVGLLTKSEDVLAPMLNMVMVPMMLLSGIMLPMTLGPIWLRDVARLTPFGYIINAMRDAFSGVYFTAVMAEGIAVAIGLAIACVFVGARAFLRENA